MLCLPVASSATVIQPPCYCTNDPSRCHTCEYPGYSIFGSSSTGYSVSIDSPGDYSFSGSLSNIRSVSVHSSGVSLDGSGVTIGVIYGRPDLDLRNIRIESTGGTGISACRHIERSTIVVSGSSFATGIGNLHGTLDDTVTITVSSSTSTGFSSAYGVSGSGVVSGGEINVWVPGKRTAKAFLSNVPRNKNWLEMKPLDPVTSPIDKQEYKKATITMSVPGGTKVREIYDAIPVVTTHGYCGDRTTFSELERILSNADPRVEIWNIHYEAFNTWYTETAATEFKRKLDEKRTCADQNPYGNCEDYNGPIDIVCHSMGALE